MRLGIAAAGLLCASLMAGCHGYEHLYPVQGPLAALAPVPVYTSELTVTHAAMRSNNSQGKFAVTLANGEQFNGTWKTVSDQTGAGNTASDPLAGAWDAVYGAGYYTAHVLGTPLFVHTEMTGTQGTTLTVEWYERVRNEGENRALIAKGIAKDSKGNLYKLVF